MRCRIGGVHFAKGARRYTREEVLVEVLWSCVNQCPRKGRDEGGADALPSKRVRRRVSSSAKRPTPKPHPFLRFSSISSSLPALPAASSTTRNTTGTKPYVAAASTTNSVATTGITDGGKTPSTSGSRRTTSGTGASSAAAAVGTRTPSSVRRTRARWSRAVRTGVDADAEVGGGCKLIATVAEWDAGQDTLSVKRS